jgi:hypothetical protein
MSLGAAGGAAGGTGTRSSETGAEDGVGLDATGATGATGFGSNNPPSKELPLARDGSKGGRFTGISVRLHRAEAERKVV